MSKPNYTLPPESLLDLLTFVQVRLSETSRYIATTEQRDITLAETLVELNFAAVDYVEQVAKGDEQRQAIDQAMRGITAMIEARGEPEPPPPTTSELLH